MMELLSRFVIRFIIICFAAGLVSIGCAYYHIYEEKKQLISFIKIFHQKRAAYMVSRKKVLEAIEKALPIVFNSQSVEETNKQIRSHLKTRLDAICNAVPDDNNRTEQATYTLPSLHDLHELTMQTEQSRWDVSALQTIISFLLILGILGTLTGVHSMMSAEQINIGDLKPALRPSMLAVSFTIILMLFRGFYTRAADAYVDALDTFTMNQLLPKLNIQVNTSKAAVVFVRKLQGLSDIFHKRCEHAKQLMEECQELQASLQGKGGGQNGVQCLSLRALNENLHANLPSPPIVREKHHDTAENGGRKEPTQDQPDVSLLRHSERELDDSIQHLQQALTELHSDANVLSIIGSTAPLQPVSSAQ